MNVEVIKSVTTSADGTVIIQTSSGSVYQINHSNGVYSMTGVSAGSPSYDQASMAY